MMVTGRFTSMTQQTSGGWDEITAADVAAYVRDVAEQLANMARQMGLDAVAQPLEQAQLAASAVLQENAAPDDAA